MGLKKNNEKIKNKREYVGNTIVAIICWIISLFVLGYVFSGIAYVLFNKNYKLSFNDKRRRKLNIVGQTVSAFFFGFSSAYHTQSIEIPLNERIISCSIIGVIFSVICFFVLNSKDKKRFIDEIEIYKCDNCGADVLEQDLECSSCGAKFVVEEEIYELKQNDDKKISNEKKSKTIYCKKCGGKLDKNKKCTKCGKQYFNLNFINSKSKILIIILSILFVISVIVNIYQSVLLKSNKDNNELEINELMDKITELEDNNYYLKDELEYNEDKIDFMDEHIVIVVEGHGDLAYKYDCLEEYVEGDYTFWAYNKENAIQKGYKIVECK